MSQYLRFPVNGIPTYPTFADFPASASDGATGIALDTDTLYIFNAGTTSWVPVGGSSTVLTVGTIDSQSKSANGAVIASNSLVLQTADATHPGLMSATTQTIAGNKTFTGAISASNLSGTNTGDVTLGTANGLSLVGQALSLTTSSSSTTGALTSTDWSTFNSKQASGTYITALTGDGTASGPGSAALTLSTVNSNVGSFGSASAVGAFTVNAKGLITAASSSSIQIAESQVTNLVSDLAGKQPLGNYITALTGDVTASGPGSVAATLAATSNATLTTLSALTTASSLATVGTITSGTWSATTIALNKGGTGQTTKAAAFDALSPMTTGGDIIYGGASGTGTRLANGSAGQVLTSNGTTLAPTWETPSSGTIKAAYIRDEKAQNTNGGSSVTTTWTTRTLNTITDPSSIVSSLSSNQFTLAAGTYLIEARCPFWDQGGSTFGQARLFNVTDSSVTLIGSTCYAGQSTVQNNPQIDAIVKGIFTIAGTKALRLEHIVSVGLASVGFGVAANFTTEVYTQVNITQLS